MSRTPPKPPVVCVVSVEAETDKAYLLLLLARNPRFDYDWMGTNTKSWFPKSQASLENSHCPAGKKIVKATIQEWIATKNGFTADIIDSPQVSFSGYTQLTEDSFEDPNDRIPF